MITCRAASSLYVRVHSIANCSVPASVSEATNTVRRAGKLIDPTYRMGSEMSLLLKLAVTISQIMRDVRGRKHP